LIGRYLKALTLDAVVIQKPFGELELTLTIERARFCADANLTGRRH